MIAYVGGDLVMNMLRSDDELLLLLDDDPRIEMQLRTSYDYTSWPSFAAGQYIIAYDNMMLLLLRWLGSVVRGKSEPKVILLPAKNLRSRNIMYSRAR